MMKEVKVVDLIEYINDNYNVDGVEVSRDDFVEGSGVYSIVIGSRGYVEVIKKVEDFKLKSVDELIEELSEDLEDEEELEYLEEFVDSGEIDWNDLGGVFEGLGEEDRIEYYNVVV